MLLVRLLGGNRLVRAGYNQAGAGLRKQILGRFIKPAGIVFLGLSRRL